MLASRKALLAETGATALALTLLAVLVLGDYVERGGFAWDDWANAATTAYPPRSGFLGPVNLNLFSFRPLLALLLAGEHVVLGQRPELHLAVALALAVAFSTASFAVLRAFGVDRGAAVAVAALVLLFPWSDSTRLWATAGVNNVAVVLWLLGVLLALRAFEARGRRALALHAGAVALYVASVLTYQATAVVVLVSLAASVYRLRWRGTSRWRLGAVALVAVGMAAALGFVAVDTARGIGDSLVHAGQLATGALDLLGRSVVPVKGAPHRALGVVVLSAVALLGAWAWGEREAAGSRPTRSMRLAAVGLLVIACAYAVFIPANVRYVPWRHGTANRVNMVAALGYSMVAVGLVRALVSLAGATLARARVSAPVGRTVEIALGVMLTAAVATGWALALRADARAWEQANVLRGQVLSAIERRAHVLRPGTAVLTVGHPVYRYPGIPVFGMPWDLDGAVKVTFRTSRLAARPLHPDEPLRCGPHSIGPAPAFGDRPETPRYGHTVLLDVGRGTTTLIDAPRTCRTLAARRTETPPTAEAADPPVRPPAARRPR